MLLKRLVVVLFFVALCLAVCKANGIPAHITMGVLYVVPAAMAATILVALIVVVGMLCSRRGSPHKYTASPAVPLDVATDFGGDGGGDDAGGVADGVSGK